MPDSVKVDLDSTMCNDDDSSEGWDPERPDVIFFETVCCVFDIVSIFLFTTRIVLYEVDTGIYPLCYMGVIILSTFYKLNRKLVTHRHALIYKT